MANFNKGNKRVWKLKDFPATNELADWKVYNTRLGFRTSKHWPWTKLKVGGWFFIPFHKTKSSKALGKGLTIWTVRQSWQHTKRVVAWIPDIKKRKMHIVVALHPKMDGGKGRLGVLVTRLK
jgi:hypothetical protein